MTTKARIAALQWFHDRGEINDKESINNLGLTMIRRMLNDGQLGWRSGKRLLSGVYSLTDKGRQDLHEATK